MGVEVCPVHIAEFKGSHISSIHVAAMFNSQLRGLKRKHAEDDDEDEDREDPPTAPSRRMQTYSQRRLSMLNTTYDKLNKIKQTADSNLRSYVLMLNTMRKIEREMEKDGIKVDGLTGSTFLPAVNNQIELDSRLTDVFPSTTTTETQSSSILSSVNYATDTYTVDSASRTVAASVINSPQPPNNNTFGCGNSAEGYSADYEKYFMVLDDPSSGRATPFVRTEVDSGALWNDDSDRLPSLNWSSVLKIVDGDSASAIGSLYSDANVDSSAASCSYDASSSSSGCSDCSLSDDAISNSETSLHTLMPATTVLSSSLNNVGVYYCPSTLTSPNMSSASGSTSPNPGSSPTSSEDEIFGDIDVALYDYDFTPLSPPNVKMTPVSAEELMQSLSNDQTDDNLQFLKSDYDDDSQEPISSVKISYSDDDMDT
ncbi:serine-rich adhesin for platelets-like [Uloborus diversus]|uniref:serine-rich adhesin for platelets-like n=1 Tax=Uloborus diversus TaxID=327109 RepID=UPI00240A08D5|nr:serine-rich adhesin for platelets-like [Uloborus diversus]